MRRLKEIRLTSMTNSSSASMLVIPSDKDSSFDDIFYGDLLLFIKEDSKSNNFTKKISNYELFKKELKKASFNYINRLEEDFVVYLVNENEKVKNFLLFVLAVESFVEISNFYHEFKKVKKNAVENRIYKILRKIGNVLLPGNEFVKIYLEEMKREGNLFIAKFSTLNSPLYIYANYLKILFNPVLDRKTYDFDEEAILENYRELKNRVKTLLLIYEEEKTSFLGRSFTQKTLPTKLYRRFNSHEKNRKSLFEDIVLDSIIEKQNNLETNVFHREVNALGKAKNVNFSISSRKGNELVLYDPQENIYAIYELGSGDLRWTYKTSKTRQ